MIDLKPLNLTPEFVREFRTLGKSIGYRNLGRAIAYAVVLPPLKDSTPIIAGNGNGSKGYARNGSRKRRFNGLRCAECTRVGEDGRQVLDTHRYEHKAKFPFTYAIQVSAGVEEWSKVVADNKRALERWIRQRPRQPDKCCHRTMGLMPSWDGSARWRYQCEVNPAHYKDVELVIWAKAQKGA